MTTDADLLDAFEVHSPGEIARILADDVSPTAPIGGKRPIDCLFEGYLRSTRFPDCLRVLLDAGTAVCRPPRASRTSKRPLFNEGIASFANRLPWGMSDATPPTGYV